MSEMCKRLGPSGALQAVMLRVKENSEDVAMSGAGIARQTIDKSSPRTTEATVRSVAFIPTT